MINWILLVLAALCLISGTLVLFGIGWALIVAGLCFVGIELLI